MKPATETKPEEIYIDIPSFIFRDRSVSVFEAMVEYLVKSKRLTYHEIALMLNRNDRTIWTVYHRVKQKRLQLKNRKL